MTTYYLTFRRILEPALDGSAQYGPQVTVFTEKAPKDAYIELKLARTCYHPTGSPRLAVAYGREGDKPTRDSHPGEPWDSDAGEGRASGSRS